MATFVRFKTESGLDIHINVEHVTHVFPGKEFSTIAMTGGQGVQVKAPADEVMALLEGTLT